MAKLYFYYSTMNAGKSTTLLQSSYNYRERNMNTMVYTAAMGLKLRVLLFVASPLFNSDEPPGSYVPIHKRL